jgi:DNA helicase-2/ATP-dependent DNA helicase PcrA
MGSYHLIKGESFQEIVVINLGRKISKIDDVDPSSILATTFTRKTAAKLTTRILSWRDEIRQALPKDQQFQDIHPYLRRLEFNQIITGTLDSVSNDVIYY